MAALFWSEASEQRNRITRDYEPTQPFVLMSFMERLGATRFVDVGSNIGYYAMLVSLLPGVAAIHAFEAEDRSFAELARNIDLNGLRGRVTAEKVAISGRVGHVDFAVADPLSGINSVAETTFHRAELFREMRRIPCRPLDDAVCAEGERIGLKIDVEGHEAEVIAGAGRLLSRNTCVLQVEIYKDGGKMDQALLECGLSRIFRVGGDVYYSNAPELRDPTVRLAALEDALERVVDFTLGRWPDPSKALDVVTVRAERRGNAVAARIEADRRFFHGDVEYAFYLMVQGRKSVVLWYTDSPEATFPLSDAIAGCALEVRGFVREKANPDKKVMKKARVI